MNAAIRPKVQALLIADHVYEDKVTNKKVICGVFSAMHFVKHHAEEDPNGEQQKLHVPQGGIKAGSPFAFISVTDVSGIQEFLLRYVELSTEKVIFSCQIAVVSDDRLKCHEIAIPLPELPAKEGVFGLELLWFDEPIGCLRIVIREHKPGESQGGSDAGGV